VNSHHPWRKIGGELSTQIAFEGAQKGKNSPSKTQRLERPLWTDNAIGTEDANIISIFQEKSINLLQIYQMRIH
jgi:hypothetical protein